MKIYIPKTVISLAWLIWYILVVDNINIREASLWVKLPFMIIICYSWWLVLKGIDADIAKVIGMKYVDNGEMK